MDFRELNDEARSILKGYKAYVELDREEYYVFSDIHGRIEAARLVRKLLDEGKRVIVLGDYTTRLKPCPRPGEDSIEVLKILYEALIEYPDRLVLLRGNHEDQSVHYMPVSLLLADLKRHFGDNVNAMEEELMRTMREMPLVALARGLLMHGGVPFVHLPPDGFLERLEKPYDACKEPYYEVVRNGPSSSGKASEGIMFSCLGEPKVAYNFGYEEALKALEAYDAEFILVGHVHPSSGFRRYRKLPNTYAVCSSYATCGVRTTKYVRVSPEGLVGITIGRTNEDTVLSKIYLGSWSKGLMEELKKYILSLFVDESGNEKIVYIADIYPAVLERSKAKGSTISLEELQKLLDEMVSEGLLEKLEGDKYKISEKGKQLLE